MSKKTSFGQLLRYYRERERFTLQRLAQKLDTAGYPINYGTISKYEVGSREVNGKFIYYCSICLNLNGNESNALIQAYLLDLTLNFLEEYLGQ